MATPHLNFDHFSVRAMASLWQQNRIFINEEYQRSEIWKPYQRKNLIDSIIKGFSIGVCVIWENRDQKLEILDGQQRIKTIIRFVNDEFKNNDNKKFTELSITEQSEILAYRIYYLDLKSYLKEEEVSDIFTRLQEGTPLNIAEKVNAFHGQFRKSFINIFFDNQRFFSQVKNYRFRARFLSAQFLFLELKSDFNKREFPNMKYLDFKLLNQKYKNQIPLRKCNICSRYIKLLGTFLYNELGAIHPRDLISIYLLTSYLSKRQAMAKGLGIYLRKFVIEFMKKITSFSIYDTKPPSCLNQKTFKKYMAYKQQGRKAVTFESIEKRFKFILLEYKILFPTIKFKDPRRLFNEEEKVRIYWKQDALCSFCKRPLDFNKAECHHKNEHTRGGLTRIKNGKIVHHVCHEKIHKT